MSAEISQLKVNKTCSHSSTNEFTQFDKLFRAFNDIFESYIFTLYKEVSYCFQSLHNFLSVLQKNPISAHLQIKLSA